VQPGDTLYSIAEQFDTTVSQLKKWNGLTSDRIRAGDQPGSRIAVPFTLTRPLTLQILQSDRPLG
jgi:LysM repeat protein